MFKTNSILLIIVAVVALTFGIYLKFGKHYLDEVETQKTEKISELAISKPLNLSQAIYFLNELKTVTPKTYHANNNKKILKYLQTVNIASWALIIGSAILLLRIFTRKSIH